MKKINTTYHNLPYKYLLILAVVAPLLVSCGGFFSTTYKVKSHNPDRTFTYVNGFEKYEIVPITNSRFNDTITLHQIRFINVHSAKYTNKLMYDNFGKWDTIIQPKDTHKKLLVWKNVKLLSNSNQLFTVIPTGEESLTEMYAGVYVFDSNNNDCFAPNAPFKTDLINFFSNAIYHLSKNTAFYKLTY